MTGDGGSRDDGSRDGDGSNSYAAARERLVDRFAREESFDESTLAAVRAVPRHAFVPPANRDRAYENRPLPIGSDQTISAPRMVASMVDLLDLSPGERVLEIGTGCGYHAAVTAEVIGAPNLYSVEYRDGLAREARDRLDDLGYDAVSIRTGDGNDGWPEHAPYDAAYLTCAAPAFPTAVVEQVRPGGLLLGPLGETGRPGASQRLVVARRRADGSLDRDTRGRVRFVPMQEN